MGQALEDINLDDLRVNQASLNITSHQSSKLWMYTLSEDCIRCPLTKFREVEAWNQHLVKIDASRSMEWKFFDVDLGRYAFDNATALCAIKPNNLGPHGVYNVDIHADQCSYDVRLNPVNFNLSFLYALLILTAVLVLTYTSNYIYRRYNRTKQPTAVNEVNINETKPTKTARLRSLDTFRGVSY